MSIIDKPIGKPVRKKRATLDEAIRATIKKQLIQALLASGGNITVASQILGVHRVTIHKWKHEFKI